MATASSSKTAVDETPQEDCVWTELKLLRSVVVQSRLSQALLKFVDNFLWTVEKCAEWSLPRQEVVEDESRKAAGKPELVRPLPWLLFLPSLVMLRVIRMTWNVGAFMLGYSKITPSGMVKFVQISRRYLNAARNKGTKEKYETKVTTTSGEKSMTESVNSAANSRDSTSESEKEDEEETLIKKLDRLALENSEDDEDFPANCSVPSDTSSDENDDEDDDDSNVSQNEIRDINEDATAFKKDLNNEIKKFLDAEQAAALTPTHEIVGPVCSKRSSAKVSRDKVEERLATSQRIDSPERSSQEGDPIFYSPISSDSDMPKECSVSSASIAEQCVSREILKTKQLVNGEARFISASTISESKSSGRKNGVVVEKRSTNVSKYHKGKRTSHGNRKKK